MGAGHVRDLGQLAVDTLSTSLHESGLVPGRRAAAARGAPAVPDRVEPNQPRPLLLAIRSARSTRAEVPLADVSFPPVRAGRSRLVRALPDSCAPVPIGACRSPRLPDPSHAADITLIP